MLLVTCWLVLAWMRSKLSEAFLTLQMIFLWNLRLCIRSNSANAYIHNWLLQPFSQDYGLAAHTTHIVCCNFICEWWILRNHFMAGLFTLRVFIEEIAEEYFFSFSFWYLTWDANPVFISNKNYFKFLMVSFGECSILGQKRLYCHSGSKWYLFIREDPSHNLTYIKIAGIAKFILKSEWFSFESIWFQVRMDCGIKAVTSL